MYSKLFLKIAAKLEYFQEFRLADKLEKFAQEMSVPYYKYPEQTRNTYKNKIPIEKDYRGDNQEDIDRKFINVAKIYVEQLVKDPLGEENTNAKIMFDLIINDPVYKIEKSSFVGLINGYRRIYSDIVKNSKNVSKLAELKPDAERILLRILGKM